MLLGGPWAVALQPRQSALTRYERQLPHHVRCQQLVHSFAQATWPQQPVAAVQLLHRGLRGQLVSLHCGLLRHTHRGLHHEPTVRVPLSCCHCTLQAQDLSGRSRAIEGYQHSEQQLQQQLWLKAEAYPRVWCRYLPLRKPYRR